MEIMGEDLTIGWLFEAKDIQLKIIGILISHYSN
jgi:hypothetical protein